METCPFRVKRHALSLLMIVLVKYVKYVYCITLICCRRSEKVNTIYVYHLERKVWMEFTKLSNQAIFIPPPIAYHSSVVVGDYMVIYGN